MAPTPIKVVANTEELNDVANDLKAAIDKSEPEVTEPKKCITDSKPKRVPLNERILSSLSHRSIAAHPWHDLEIGTLSLILKASKLTLFKCHYFCGVPDVVLKILMQVRVHLLYSIV
jgi:hypothetical protein